MEHSAPEDGHPAADTVSAEVSGGPLAASADTPSTTGAGTPEQSPAAGLATSTEAAAAPVEAPVEDTGELATEAQWGLLDAHRDRVNATKIHRAARDLFPEADIRSNSQITKVQFEKAFLAVMDRTTPEEE